MRKSYWLNGWQIIVWFDSDVYDAESIIDDLIVAGARGKDLKMLSKLLWERKYNQGVTYVDDRTNRCVVAIGKASKKGEYANSIAHEIGHLSVMLADAMNIDLRSESYAYLLGDITQMLWEDSHKYTCPKCSCEH